jgi:DNA replication and repair protein RecF
MLLARMLRLRDVRSYEEEELELGPVLTVIHGPNGAGKTNLLEALYFACTGRSCRTSNGREFVRFGQSAARVELDVEDDDGIHELAIGFEPGSPRRVTADGGTVERLADVSFRPLACVFLPDDLELVKGSPGVRRDHIDRLVAGLWPARSRNRAEYSRTLAQRNALLARIRSGAADREAIAAWDLELGRHAIALRDTRLEALEAVREPARDFSIDLGLPGGLELSYRPRSTAETPEEFAAELEERLDSDLQRGFTGHGPHRDELRLEREGRELRSYGSQGEQRLALLSLLLAEREALAASRGRPPILLLDDVMSELDASRREMLVDRVTREGQTVITTTDLAHVPLEGVEDALSVSVEAARIVDRQAAR